MTKKIISRVLDKDLNVLQEREVNTDAAAHITRGIVRNTKSNSKKPKTEIIAAPNFFFE